MRKARKIMGMLLIMIVLAADFMALPVFGTALDKAFVHIDVDKEAHLQAERNGLFVAEELENEGIVLLKNNGALPIRQESKKINLLGYRSYNPVYSGSGSGGSAYLENRVSIVQALEQEGFEVNPEVRRAYEKIAGSSGNTFKVNFSIDEQAADAELAAALNQEYLFENSCSFQQMKEFSDTAIIVFGRAGGEDNDLPMCMEAYTDYPSDQEKHYLELNEAEKSLLHAAEETFDTLIVLINTSNAMELGFLNESGVDAALWIGSPGDVGAKSVAGVLAGRVNPSGRTVDTYPYAVESIPSYYNFGEFSYTNTADIFNRKKDQPQTAFLVEYQEGIYIGYRYFESRKHFDYVTREGEEIRNAAYEDVVQYPFGYGLSYTEFVWETEDVQVSSELNPDSEIKLTVKVTNVGDLAGKDVVELFYSAPYHRVGDGSGIQKAAVVLGDYQKTTLLEPGESQVLTLSLCPQDMASYDEGYFTHNGSYVLEAGDYQISLRRNAHTVYQDYAYPMHLAQTLVYSDTAKAEHSEEVICLGQREGDQTQVHNLFEDIAGDVNYLNRETWEITPGSSREASEEQLTAFREARELNEEFISTEDATPIMGKVTAGKRLLFSDMAGKAYDDPTWEDLLNQLSWRDMVTMLGVNGWGSSPIKSIKMPQIYDMDGPSAISYILDIFFPGRLTYKSVCYPSEAVIASGWNTELAEEFGHAISQEGNVFGVSGWYAPGVNIHRNPFAGRNFEYYSEDPTLSGRTACAVIKGCFENGMYCYIKHFALNEMETNRHYGVCTWASEQSMREIYLRAFEIPLKSGYATAVMSSYNNLGTTWAGACRPLLTNLLRQEWGFQGIVLTDNFEDHGFMDVETALAAGGTSLLYNGMSGTNSMKRLRATASGQQLVRNAAHQYLYTVVNSMAQKATYKTPLWRIVALPVSIILFLCGVVLISGLPKRKRSATGLRNRL